MTVESIIAEVEQHFEDPVALEGIQRRVRRDGSLADGDREFILERIAGYLADHSRGDHPDGNFDLDDVPDEGESDDDA